MRPGASWPLADGLGLWAEFRSGSDRAGPIAFLDRDGVLIEDGGYVGRAADVRMLPGAVGAVGRLTGAGWRVVIVTNQSGIGRGFYGWDGFASVQAAIDSAVVAAGGRVDAVLGCAFHAEAIGPFAVADHPWRKPRPGMILAALERLGGEPARCAMVGDQVGDIAAGSAAGLGRLFHVRPPPGGAPAPGAIAVGSLDEAALRATDARVAARDRPSAPASPPPGPRPNPAEDGRRRAVDRDPTTSKG
jgi:D-glycero-D-manno-heptose 1,7-bisphosphate phosphatase